MADYLEKWKTDFPETINNQTRPTEGIDNSLTFNTDGFPQRITSDPVHAKLENDMASQLFSNDERLKESIDAASTTESNHEKDASAHANGISGNAGSATKLKTARSINVSGTGLTGTAKSFDGSGNITIPITLANSLLAIASVTPTWNKLPYFSSPISAELTTLSAFARTILDDTSAEDVRNTINANASTCGGIVAQSLTQNGYVKWANGFIIQWVKSSVPSGKTYDDISFPISFEHEVYQIILTDWDTASITQAREYSFTVVDNKVTLTGARITVNGAAGYYKALIIGA